MPPVMILVHVFDQSLSGTHPAENALILLITPYIITLTYFITTPSKMKDYLHNLNSP